MNYIKFQTDLMKLYDNPKSQYKYARMHWAHVDDGHSKFVTVTLDGNYAVCIPECFFYLNNKFLEERRKWGYFETVLKLSDEHVPAKITGSKIVGDGDSLYILTAENGKQCFVNPKNLKYFDLKEAVFMVKDEKSGVLVYENSRLVGLVMPVLAKE